MSQAVPLVDLSLYGSGTSGILDLTSTLAKIPYNPSYTSSGDTAHIRMFNDSGSALQIHDDNGTISDYIPAGAWPAYSLDPGSTKIYFTVIQVLPNPPIQLLMCTIYGPGETVPGTPQLGNSPVGIGGTIQTSSVQTLSNEGTVKTVLVIDIGDSALAQLLTINNDGSALWKVDVASVAHVLLTIASAANFLRLGQAGDTTEVLGALTVDQLLLASLGLSVVGGSTTDTLTVTSTSTFDSGAVFNANLNVNNIHDNVSGADQIDLSTAGITLNNILSFASTAVTQIQAAGTRLLDATNTHDLILNAPNAAGTGQVIFQKGGIANIKIDQNGVNWPNGNFLPSISFFAGIGSGTYTHGFGSAPFWVCPIVDELGSATQGYDSVTATTVHVTLGAALTFKAFCG